MYVNPSIFRAYDIRGEFPDEINAKAAYTIARAYAEFLRAKDSKSRPLTIVIAEDGRPSSPELKKAVLQGLLEEGMTVVDMGFSTTPFHYFAVIKAEADAGIMVTASHNPQRMNGLKLSRRGAEPLGEGMEVVKNIARRGIFQTKSPHPGTVITQSLAREYIQFLLSKVDLSSAAGFTVAFDVGGGMASVLLPLLIKKLPCETIILNEEMTYASAFKSLNPSKEEDLATLKNAVLEKRADFGVALDQDGDRSGFVTRNARFFRSDYVAAYFAREFLKRAPGSAVIHDVRSSSIFRETVVASGGRAIESRVGHSFIKALMRKEDAVFAAELSGHFYFKDFFYLDSDFLPVLYFLEFLSKAGKTSDELLEQFEVYPSSGELSFKIEEKPSLLEQIAARFHDARETKWIDGLSVLYDDWWANIRPSNTESFVRLNVEARTDELLAKKVEELKKLIQT